MKERQYLKILDKIKIKRASQDINERASKHLYTEPTVGRPQVHLQQNKDSSLQIYKTIKKIKPFSVIYKINDVEKNLNQIFSIHKEGYNTKINNNLGKPKLKSQIKRSNSFLEENKQLIINIKRISKVTYLKKRKNLIQDQTFKTEQNDYDDIQGQVANQMITETKNQQKKLKQTLSNYEKYISRAAKDLIQDAGLNYSTTHLRNAQSLKQIRQKQKVIKKYNDVLHLYEQGGKNQVGMKFNKEDTSLWLKSLRRIMSNDVSYDYSKRLRQIRSMINTKMPKISEEKERTYSPKHLRKPSKSKEYYNHYKSNFLSSKR